MSSPAPAAEANGGMHWKPAELHMKIRGATGMLTQVNIMIENSKEKISLEKNNMDFFALFKLSF